MRHASHLSLLATAALMAIAAPAAAHDAALEAEVATLKAHIVAQDAQMAAIQAQLVAIANAQQTQASMVATQGQTVASLQTQTQTIQAAQTVDATATAKPATSATTIGGYGEIAYNGYVHNASRNQADLKRFVLFFGHRFNDKLSFNSEVEWEHAVTSATDKGESEIEQAYLNYAFTPKLNVKAGLFLMPFGFINRNHEPPVFYGVERNEVERRIIPSTWREGGVSIWGTTTFGLSYDVGVATGFNVAKLDDASAPLLATHQELQFAHAANLSVYGSLEYRGVPGLLIGGAVFSGGATHNNSDFRADATLPDFSGIKSRVTLWDVHAGWQVKGFDFKALYTHGSISQAGALDTVLTAYNTANGTTRPLIPGAFEGWYAQGAYTFDLGGTVTLSPFARYETYNTQSQLPFGLIADPANRDRVLTAGFSFKPLSDVVVKADYQSYLVNTANSRFNLGLGYMF